MIVTHTLCSFPALGIVNKITNLKVTNKGIAIHLLLDCWVVIPIAVAADHVIMCLCVAA